MKGRFFLDTNILVYNFDGRAPAKQNRARQLVAEALTGRHGIISYQVVQEFLNVALRKFDQPMTPSEAQLYLAKVLLPLCEVSRTPHSIRKGSPSWRRPVSAFTTPSSWHPPPSGAVRSC